MSFREAAEDDGMENGMLGKEDALSLYIKPLVLNLIRGETAPPGGTRGDKPKRRRLKTGNYSFIIIIIIISALLKEPRSS